MADDAWFGQDGTQDPPPPPLAPDPLAGLVTGQMFGGFDQNVTATPKVVPAAPPKPDERAIRQAVDAALVNERGRQRARPAQTRRVARPAPVVPRTTIGPRGADASMTAAARARAVDAGQRRRANTGLGCAFLVILVLAVIVFFVVQGAGGNLSGLFQ